jgi:hypothetical protein
MYFQQLTDKRGAGASVRGQNEMGLSNLSTLIAPLNADVATASRQNLSFPLKTFHERARTRSTA